MEQNKQIHFIAIGGSVMHNLAIDLHLKGIKITGSDDEIFDPSRGNLEKHQLLPEKEGWFPEKIHQALDAVILGMHAREDNPELKKAKELGLKIYTFPEYIFEHSRNKQRIVVAGSHGKTTITAIILHVLQSTGKDFDYLIGAQVEGLEQSVKLSDTAPIIILEGDEYFTSVLDSTPKFLHYKHHIGIISGIAWDHVNVFPTMEDYVSSFEKFADQTPKAGTLIYSQDDGIASVVCRKERSDVIVITYTAHKHKIKDGKTFLITPDKKEFPLQVFGEHNMQNINAAKTLCSKIGITDEMFYEAIASFKGAENRLEKVSSNENSIFFKDFAHAPSKLLATTQAVKQQFPNRKLIACLELHTFSSLNKSFLTQYYAKFKAADLAVVYYNPKTIEHKRLEHISPEDIQRAFNHKNLKVFDKIDALENFLEAQDWEESNLLMMSSGNFDNLDLETLSQRLIPKI